jgi:ADP-heptose:LPS heptosyltransferase
MRPGGSLPRTRARPMKILVISMAGIGDTLLATPLIHELRANFPGAVIDALVLWPGSRDLLENNPHLNFIHQRNLMKESKRASFRFLWSLRKQNYDVSINTHPQSRVHYRVAARIIGAPIRISHDYECSGWLDRWLVNRTLPQNYEKQSIENNLDLLPFLDAKPKLPRHEMEVYLFAAEEAWAESFVAAHDLGRRQRLGIHVGSGGTKNLPLKRWPLPHYLELVKRLNRERPEVSVLLFGGPEEEKDHDAILAQADARLVLRTGTKNLRQAAALVKRCDAFLSVDTALMHLAAAVKVPRQIVIEAPTLNPTNLPYGHPFTLVKNPTVAGRNLEYYRYDGRDIRGTREELLRCMASVSVGEVIQAVEQALPNPG